MTEGLQIATRKPDWLRSTVRTGPDYLRLKHTMRDLDLVTVCEEAGCPNIFECWADGTATFMINGERCTRACGFCLVDTRHPEPLDPGEPERVAEAVERMGLGFAVVTAVARDDLADGGASGVRRDDRGPSGGARRACRSRCSIPDCKGDEAALATIFDARPDVLNHNIETVARLQRAVRPSAGYARSLAVLARAKAAGLTTKSGLIVGMGETDDEVVATLADLRAVGVDIVTIGQYLRPTTNHLPVARWVEPATFDRYQRGGRGDGHRPRRGEPAHPLELPRPPGGGSGGRDRGRLAVARLSLSGAGRDGRRLARTMVRMLAERADRARTRMAELGVDVLLLSVGPDLPYLTGYEAMPLERLTMLVLPRDGDATLVVPALEAPRVVERPDVFALRPWERDRRPDRHRGRAGRARPAPWRSATAPGPRFVVDLQAALPAAALRHGERRSLGPLRASRTRPRSRPCAGPPRPPTGSPPTSRRARSRWSGAPRPTCRPTSAAASSPRATSA